MGFLCQARPSMNGLLYPGRRLSLCSHQALIVGALDQSVRAHKCGWDLGARSPPQLPSAGPSWLPQHPGGGPVLVTSAWPRASYLACLSPQLGALQSNSKAAASDLTLSSLHAAPSPLESHATLLSVPSSDPGRLTSLSPATVILDAVPATLKTMPLSNCAPTGQPTTPLHEPCPLPCLLGRAHS